MVETIGDKLLVFFLYIRPQIHLEILQITEKMFVCERPRNCPREKYNLQNTKNSNKNLRITYEQFTSFQILNFHEFISVELPLQINHQSGLHNDNNFNILTGQPSSIHFHFIMRNNQFDSKGFNVIVKYFAIKVERIVALKETLHPYFKMIASEF